MTNILIILLGVTMIYIASVSRVESYIKALSIQGLLLFLMILIDYSKIDKLTFIFLSVETIGLKALIIPLFLINIIRKNEIVRDIEPNISNFYSIFISSLIFVFGFFSSYLSLSVIENNRPLHFGISFSIIITSLFLIITRKKIITHIMGYMMLENGIFLLSLSIAKEMPFIVNLGVLLDLFLAIFLFSIFINKIKTEFEEVHIDRLTDLKD
jgi:hydrogenase-4 component E